MNSGKGQFNRARRKSRAWHAQRIKAEIKIRRGKLATFAADLGVNPSLVGKVCAGRQSRKVQRAISELIDVPLHSLWPDRYDERNEWRGNLPRGRHVVKRRSLS